MSLSNPPPLVSPAALGNQLKPNSPHGIKHSAHGMQLLSSVQELGSFRPSHVRMKMHPLSQTFPALMAPSPTHALIHINVHQQKKNSVYGNSTREGGRQLNHGRVGNEMRKG